MSGYEDDLAMIEADMAMAEVEHRVLALDRVWDLVTNSEAADQDTIAVADIRAAITTSMRP
jgi:two-component sensor histidine kinase